MFVYVAQGRAKEIDILEETFSGRKLITLTWDEMREGSIFLPNSTWSQGRRVLYESALKGVAFEYVVFMDGDVRVEPEALLRFESCVLELQPAVAIPVFEKTRKYEGLSFRRWQLAYDSDEQFQAIHRDVLAHFFGGSPYISDYDSRSWWYPCVIMQNMLRKYLWRSFVQINGVFVENVAHGAYPNSFSPSFIDGELRRLRIRSPLPLSSNGRVKGRQLLLVRQVDYLISLTLNLLSTSLYRSWYKLGTRALPPEVRAMIMKAG